MNDVAQRIADASVPEKAFAVWWLGQAGFVFKSGQGTVIYVDPYLSNVVERAFGFKRLSLAPIDAEDVRANWLVSSHEHLDHLDTDALPTIAANNPACRFAGSISCEPEYEKCGIGAERRIVLSPGGAYSLNDVTLHTALADHGDLSPTALSLLFDFGGVRVLFTGDTALNLERMQPLIDMKPALLLPCINGKFGNLGSVEAAQLAHVVNPRIVIPCHFWMFKEHNGDPESFVQACAETCPGVPLELLTPGTGIVIDENGQIVRSV